MRRIPWRRLQGQGHHPLHVGIGDRPRRPGPRLIKQAVEPPLDNAVAPDRLPCRGEPSRHCLVRLAVGAGDHEPSASGDSLRGLPPPRLLFQRLSFVSTQNQLSFSGVQFASVSSGVGEIIEDTDDAELIPVTSDS